MGMTKGKKHYPNSIKIEIVEKQKSGKSVSSLSREYGISRYSIQSWCGLRPEKNIIQASKRKGRPRKTELSTEKAQELRIKELERENDLLRSFLQAVGEEESKN